MSDFPANPVTPDGTAGLALEGACNVRELGGTAVEGGRVRRGVLWRGDSPHRMTAGDLEVMRALRCATVVDLRSPKEVGTLGSAEFGADVRRMHAPVDAGSGVPRAFGGAYDVSPDDFAALYVAYVDESAELLRDLFATFAEPDTVPVFVHCLAGKDRTGVVVALLLLALGANDDTIVADYMVTDRVSQRSAELSRRDMLLLGLDPDRTAAPGMVHTFEPAMAGFVTEIRRRHPRSVDLTTWLGLNGGQHERLRRNFVDPE